MPSDYLKLGLIIPSSEIFEFVESQMHGVNADCIFLSCTNWQAIDAIDFVEAHFRLPAISSNQATIEAVRKLMLNYQAAQASGQRAGS